MIRRYWIAMPLAWSACGRPARDPASLLPATAGEGWLRSSLHGVSPPNANILRAFEATYGISGHPETTVTVDLYEGKTSGTAFEMTQHWKASPDSVFFDKGTYFVTIKWKQADRAALHDLVRALQKNLEK